MLSFGTYLLIRARLNQSQSPRVDIYVEYVATLHILHLPRWQPPPPASKRRLRAAIEVAANGGEGSGRVNVG